jgi:OmpA-OmpF porin, OOP family
MQPLAIFACITATAALAACASQPAPPPAAPPPAAAATPPPAPTPPPASPEQLVIDFDTGSAALLSDAVAKLDKAGRLYRDASPTIMTVAGHSDKTGAEFPNLLLSAHRAEAVKQGLVDRGIPAERLQIEALGQAEPASGETPARTAVITWR